MSNDGGAAFPRQGQQRIGHDKNPLDPYGGYGWLLDPQEGMTLRDYFAAKSMQSYITYVANVPEVLLSRSYDEIAAESYSIADAMLTARSTP